MPSHKHRVLLVDDDSAVRRSLERDLTEAGYTVESSGCAAEALVVLNHATFDVVICDYRMPGMSGLDFLGTVREQYPDVHTFLLSGEVAQLSVATAWARKIGVVDVLSKPCSCQTIIHAIESASKTSRRPQLH